MTVFTVKIKVCRSNFWWVEANNKKKIFEMYFSCKHFYNLVTTHTNTRVHREWGGNIQPAMFARLDTFFSYKLQVQNIMLLCVVKNIYFM